MRKKTLCYLTIGVCCFLLTGATYTVRERDGGTSPDNQQTAFAEQPAGEKNTSQPEASEELQEGFVNPPASAKPHTWWHFMNNNISMEGVKADLEAMRDVGIGGFQLFQTGTGIARGTVPYGSEEWARIINYAGELSDEYGLQMGMHNCPGWSSTGGPWMNSRPDLSMKQLVWSETHVNAGNSGQAVKVKLPQPFTLIDYYEDAVVLAFPSVKGEETAYQDLLEQVTSDNEPKDISPLVDYKLSTGIAIEPGAEDEEAHLSFEFQEPYTLQSIEIYSGSTGPRQFGGFGGGASGAAITLEASDDGISFRKISDVEASSNAGNADITGVIVPGYADFDPVTAKYFRLTSSEAVNITQLRLSGGPIIYDWVYKTNHESAPPSRWNVDFDPLTPTQQVSSDYIIDPSSVIDITEYMDQDGNLVWNAPEGNWTIMRFGETSLALVNSPAPDGAEGLEVDKFNKEALDYHFEYMFADIMPMLEKLGKRGLANLTIDSYEKGMQTWTTKFPEEFKARRGYEIYKYLPAFAGKIVGSSNETDRFLYDIRLTQSDLMSDNYYGHFDELCNEHGINSNAESYSYGRSLFDDLQASSRVDIPVSEFPIIGGGGFERQIVLLSSAAHLYGKKYVGAEAFTGVPNLSKWQEHPYYLKNYGDFMFALGLNRIIFHTFAHQPNTDPDVVPGMTMGQWGIYMNRNNTWWNQSKNYMKYLARTQYMLQQGKYVADLLIFSSMDAPGYVPSYKTITSLIPFGYGYDAINMETLLNELTMENGRAVTPSGMSYKILILPEGTSLMKLDLLTRIRDLVEGGLVLVGQKPDMTPSLTDLGHEQEWHDVADDLWGNLNGTSVTKRAYGEGVVYWGTPVETVLDELGIRPDFQFTSESADAPINYYHNRTGDADAYFIANRERMAHDVVATFRMEGKMPEFWNPNTGEIAPAEIYEEVEDGIRVTMHLDPTESVFVVFREPDNIQGIKSVSRDGQTLVTTAQYDVPDKGMYPNVTDNFTISVWAKPETNINTPSGTVGLGAGGPGSDPGYVFYPVEGAQVYGNGHAATGLALGRNGIVLYERSGSVEEPVLGLMEPVTGWVHIAVVYNNGTPSLYVDGKPAAEGEKSAYTVHPGINGQYPIENTTYFVGDMVEPELFNKVLTQSEVAAIFSAGKPGPQAPPVVEIQEGKQGLCVWENGTYEITRDDGSSTAVNVEGINDARVIEGPWKISFPPKRGAPESVQMDELMSWTDYPDDGVKYFSGTATYTNQFDVSSNDLSEGKRLILDLGWVDNIAQVKINGVDLGILWTLPFRVDITDAVQTGSNSLEIQVTNVWVNRLIGDESIPTPYTYVGLGISEIPQWYSNNEPKPEDYQRVTFTTWDHHDAGDALLSSGLIGPVRIRSAIVEEP